MTRKAAEKSKEPLSPSKRRALKKQKEDIASGETAAAKAFMTRNKPYTGKYKGGGMAGMRRFNRGGKV